MKTTLAFTLLILITFTACGETSTSEVPQPEIDVVAEAEPTKSEQETLENELGKPAKPRPLRRGSLEAFFVECVTELMVKGTEGFKKDPAIKKILDGLEQIGLTPRGRPEGLVRDIVTRMIEDMEAFRPPGYTAEQLNDLTRSMLRNLGKSYLNDIRGMLDPSLKQHEGKLRRAVAVKPEKVRKGYEAITWKTLGGFTFKKGEPLPQRILDLDGKKVAHIGFMFPGREHEDIHNFLLVESLWTCCFGEPPQVTDVVKINLDPEAPGLWVMQGPILVHGTLRVKVEIEDDWVIGIYRIAADHVEKYQ